MPTKSTLLIIDPASSGLASVAVPRISWTARGEFACAIPCVHVGGEEHRFDIDLDGDARINIRIARDADKGLDWAAVLSVGRGGERRAVYLYDNAHGRPERHRFRDGTKLEAEGLPSRGAARLDLPAAIKEIKANWKGMVDRWEQ